MHETGIVRDLVRRLEQAAQDAGAVRVCAVQVWLGALSQFSPTHFREHYDDAARGTVAQGAVLHITASGDALHPQAQSVMMVSVDLDLADENAGDG